MSGALSYLATRSLRNILKSLLRPKLLIALIVYLGILITSILISDAATFRINPALLQQIYMAATVILFIIVFVATELSGLYAYSQAELIWVVSSPLPKERVFLYGVLKKAYKSLLLTFILLVFLGISAVRSLAIPVHIFLVISLGIVLLLILYFSMLVLLRVYCSRIARILICTSFTLFMGWMAVRQILTGSNDYYGLIPLSGWNYYIVSRAISGLTRDTQALFFLALVLVAGFLVYAFFAVKRADVLALLSDRQGGGGGKGREAVSLPLGGQGAWAILCKQLVELRHRGWYLFFDFGALFTCAFICVVSYAIKSSVTATGEAVPPIYAYVANAILQLIFAMTLFDVQSVKDELASAHVRLFPISPWRKMLALAALPVAKKMTVSSLFIALAGWFTGTPGFVVLLTLSSYFFAITNLVFLEFLPIGNLLVQEQMEENVKTLIWGVFKIGLGLIALLPSFGVFAFFLFARNNIWAAFLGFDLACVLLTVLLCLVYRKKAF